MEAASFLDVFHPKRYSGQRVKTPKSIKLSILSIELKVTKYEKLGAERWRAKS